MTAEPVMPVPTAGHHPVELHGSLPAKTALTEPIRHQVRQQSARRVRTGPRATTAPVKALAAATRAKAAAYRQASFLPGHAWTRPT